MGAGANPEIVLAEPIDQIVPAFAAGTSVIRNFVRWKVGIGQASPSKALEVHGAILSRHPIASAAHETYECSPEDQLNRRIEAETRALSVADLQLPGGLALTVCATHIASTCAHLPSEGGVFVD